MKLNDREKIALDALLSKAPKRGYISGVWLTYHVDGIAHQHPLRKSNEASWNLILERLSNRFPFVKFMAYNKSYYVDPKSLYELWQAAIKPNSEPDYIELCEAGMI